MRKIYKIYICVNILTLLKIEELNKSGKLWERIIHATMSNSVDEDGPGK